MSSDRVALVSQHNNPPSPVGMRHFAHKQLPRLIAQVLIGVFALGVAQAQDTLTRTERPEVKPGDQWKYELRDKRTGAKVRDTVVAVTAVSATQIDSIENGVAKVATRDLVVLKNSRLEYDVGYRWLSFPLEGLYAVSCGTQRSHFVMAGANGWAGRWLSLDMRK